MELVDELKPGVSGDIIVVEFEETVLDSSRKVRVSVKFAESKPELVRSESGPREEVVDRIPFGDGKGSC